MTDVVSVANRLDFDYDDTGPIRARTYRYAPTGDGPDPPGSRSPDAQLDPHQPTIYPAEDIMGEHVMYRRIYDDPSSTDGLRILVDRIWPRGVRRQDARLDEWMRDVAPSSDLRRWYGHDPDRYAEFRKRYLAELRDPARSEVVRRLRSSAGHDRMTLLTAARDLEHSQAAVLAHWLNRVEHA